MPQLIIFDWGKSPLQDLVLHQCARQLITARIQHLAAPSIFHTALLVGWKGPRVETRPKTDKFCILVYPIALGCDSATYNVYHDTRAWSFNF